MGPALNTHGQLITVGVPHSHPTGNDLMTSSDSDKDHVLTKRGERRVFLFIAVFLFPVLSFIVVGGYGFLIWMSQLIFGPPGSS